MCEKKAVKELFADVCKAAFGLAVFEKRKVFIFTRRGVLMMTLSYFVVCFFQSRKTKTQKERL